MDATFVNSFLANVLASPRGGYLEAGQFRRYATSVRTSSVIGGVEDSRNARIFYEIGRAADNSVDLLAPAHVNIKIESAYPTSSVLVEDFVGLAKKYSNFSASFEFSSLAAIAQRLGTALAAHSLFGDVTSDRLRGNSPLVINAMGVYDGPINSLVDTVFIPRLVNSTVTGDVFAILANAAAGEGAVVATDVVDLDANTRQPILGTVDEVGFARACVDAIRLVGANMTASDQGPLFALALTRGIHKAVSVVGHTDEGGVARDLLRCGAFSVPFGGIHFGLEEYRGIPALSTNGATYVAAYVDALALTSAGLVAHCDPGLELEGSWFPTVIDCTTDEDAGGRPGDSLDPTNRMATIGRGKLLAMCRKFFEIYCRGLGTLFGCEGNHTLAASFSSSAALRLGANPRHLRYPSVSPFFWIEPTSLLPASFLGTAAEANSSGSLGGRSTVTTRPAWETIDVAGEKDTTFSAYTATMLSARRLPMLYHWLGHPLNGLGALRIRQLDPNGVIHPGPCPGNEQVRDRVEADLPITNYLWTRGQSFLPAPSEFLNLAKTVGFLVRHVTFDDDGIPAVEHLPTSREFIDTTVTMEVGRPIGLNTGQSNAGNSDARRARTRATRELAAASARAAVYGRADVAQMPTLTTAPRHGPTKAADRGGSEGGVHGGILGRAAGTGGPAHRDRNGRAQPQNPTVHHDPLRGPAMPRPLAGGVGGGAGRRPGDPPQPVVDPALPPPVAPAGGDHPAPLPEGPLPPALAPVPHGAAPPERAAGE